MLLMVLLTKFILLVHCTLLISIVNLLIKFNRFLLGFFCLVPWLFGAFYLKARNTTARSAGILSLILATTTALVITIVVITGVK